MMSSDPSYEHLQHCLELLEAGRPLEECLAGLSEQEAALLELASGLRELPWPPRSAVTASQQRAALLNAAKGNRFMDMQSSSQGTTSGGPIIRRSWIPIAGLAGAFVLLLICGILILTGVGFSAWRGLQGQDVTEDGAPILGLGQPNSGGSAEAFEAHSADSAVLNNVRGMVGVQSLDGTWLAAEAGQSLNTGQHVRTGPMSSVVLTFYDSSTARLGPNTEVVLDSLDAQRSGGPRVIVLTQQAGDTYHTVAPATAEGSRYEVNTPSGIGAAKGTAFSVVVTTALTTQFNVDEGSVAVSAMNVTVVVVAGQSTSINPGSPPNAPTLRITGQGEVMQTGGIWAIAGQTFLTDASTVVVGNPQVGDWVALEGRYLPDGTRFADRIILIHRAPENSFSLTGTADAMGADAWTISGQTIAVDANTAVDDDIETGDLVAASGVILEDGTLLAEHISLLDEDDEDEQSFEFTGVVSSTGDPWTIGGVAIDVDDETAIDTDLTVGDLAAVEGVILSDGTWLAHSISLADEDETEFEFTGTVDSMDPWVISGIEVGIADWTEIEEGIEVGDRVAVEGRVLEDGTWVAEEISLIEDESLRFEIVGEVSSTDPWIVAGTSFTVDGQTDIEDGIEAGDTVRVTGRILPDGTLVAEEIVEVDDDDSAGCLNAAAIVRSVEGNQLVLLNWQTVTLDDEIEVEGDLEVASVIIIRSCVDDDGHVTFITIIIIYQLDALPTPPPGGGSSGGGGGDGDDDDDDD